MQVNNKYKNAVMTIDQRNQQTIAKVAKLMDLPKGENPVIYLVQDKSKLSSSETTKQFFATAQKDDVILTYQKANLSIIYRPSSKKIIKTDNYNNFWAAYFRIPVAILAQQDQQQATEKLISEKLLNIDIVSKQASKVASSKSMVVDLSGTNAKAAKELADKLGVPVGQLPEGETKPEGATLVVITASSTSPPTTP
jgi:hypothetical protein